MKTIKRAFALLLMICLVLSMMVPAVWAADTGVLTYTFGFSTDTKRVDGTAITSGNTTGKNANPYAGDPDTCKGYPLVNNNGYFLNASYSEGGFTCSGAHFQARIAGSKY